MSNFDPEQVERLGYNWAEEVVPVGSEADIDPEFVRASDYDQLLEIHLRHIGMIAELFSKCGEPLSEEKIAALKNGTWR